MTFTSLCALTVAASVAVGSASVRAFNLFADAGASTGMSNWTPEQWCIFFVGAGSFITLIINTYYSRRAAKNTENKPEDK